MVCVVLKNCTQQLINFQFCFSHTTIINYTMRFCDVRVVATLYKDSCSTAPSPFKFIFVLYCHCAFVDLLFDVAAVSCLETFICLVTQCYSLTYSRTQLSVKHGSRTRNQTCIYLLDQSLISLGANFLLIDKLCLPSS